MNLILDCYPCILRQVLSTSKLAGLDEFQAREALNHSMKVLLQTETGTSPQHVVVQTIDYIRNTFFPDKNGFDPYGELKKKSNILVLDRFDILESGIKNTPSSLEAALKNAAAGNIIDFGAKDHGSIDIDKEIRNIPLLEFSRYDYKSLVNLLGSARKLLYIGDNAGEIVFDRLLIRQLQRDFPEIGVTFATRSEPVINDVTPDDAYETGLDQEAEIISSGCRYPGLMLTEASEPFRQIYRDADIVIAKGQGNYEGLSSEEDPRLFFILRIKCERVASDIGAEVGDLVLLRKNR
jgi:uncharacterized protein with ATP-grasp and redox domains